MARKSSTKASAPPRVRIRNLRRLTAGGVHHQAPVFSSDGRYLLFQVGEARASEEGEAAWVLSDRHGRLCRVLPGVADGGAAFAKDREESPSVFAYGRRVGAATELWHLPKGERVPERLLGRDGHIYCDPAFSPKTEGRGQLLCYATDADQESGRFSLGIMDLSEGGQGPITLRTPNLQDSQGPLSLRRPAFAAPLLLYCEGISETGEVGIYQVRLLSVVPPIVGNLRRVSPLGRKVRRPQPIAPSVLVCEEDLEDGQSQLVLLLCVPDDEALLPLTQPAQCAREPALAYRKGQVRIAYARVDRPSEEEPGRYDLYEGRLSGMRRLIRVFDALAESEPEVGPETAPEDSPTASEGQPAIVDEEDERGTDGP